MENEQFTPTIHPGNKPSRQYTFTGMQVIVTAVILLVLISTLWIWKNVQIQSTRKSYQEREQQLIEKSTAQIESANLHFLKLVAKPYVWAVRTELMQGNLGQVNLYGNDIVKEKNFVSVMVANTEGAIVAATDKKYEGIEIATLGLPLNNTADSTIVNKINDSLYLVTSPIMSFNSKLGTLIINYSPSKADTLLKQ